MWAPFGIQRALIGNQLIALWAPLAMAKCADMQKDRITPAIWGNETKALLIFPCGNSTLISHRFRYLQQGNVRNGLAMLHQPSPPSKSCGEHHPKTKRPTNIIGRFFTAWRLVSQTLVQKPVSDFVVFIKVDGQVITLDGGIARGFIHDLVQLAGS